MICRCERQVLYNVRAACQAYDDGLRVWADVRWGPVAESLDVKCLSFGWGTFGVPVAESLDVKCLSFGWGTFGVCDAVEPDTEGRGEVDGDACAGWRADSEVCAIYCVDSGEGVHRGEEDVDVGAVGQSQ